ncbi:signal peptidase I [Elusimicrobium posterum]|uniref:signal peptidase I n=1 Tax=Elusimicrobium posterum TaxID=3116653 RepID=UPI003C762DBA
MEIRLFIIGVIMLIWAIAAKYLKKKNKLKNKIVFTLVHSIFIATVGALGLWLYSFVSAGGDVAVQTPVTLFTFVKIGLVIAVTIWAGFVAFNSDDKKKDKIFDTDYDWADTIYFSALLAAFVMFFFIQAFKIPSASMRETLIEGDHLFVNKFTYGFRVPFTQKRFFEFNKIERGDVIVFAFPAKTKDQINCGGPQYGRDYVKRVIAMPGETVEIKNANLYVNGEKVEDHGYEVYNASQRFNANISLDSEKYQKLWEDMELEHSYGILLRDQFGPVTVPEGTYFAMGDNRDFSCDSRFWGPVPRSAIKGKAWFIHWPINRMKFIK